MKFKACELALITALIAAVLMGTSLDREAKELSDKLVRLHVVANSDTEADQTLKLQVRDAVLDYLSPMLEGVTTAQEAQTVIEGELSKLEALARDTMGALGYDYDAAAAIREEDFPTTQYDTFALPAGEYTALRITIGAGEGHNWWCVVFPPVCETASMEETAAAAIGLSEEEVSLITTDSTGYVLKFRVLELFGMLKSLFK